MTAIAQPQIELPFSQGDSALQSGVAAALSPSDLAELIGAFNDVTVKLHSTHESLRQEVARLQGELADANLQLERTRRLAALGEMAAGIAHEVRNPLGSIRLHARILEQDLADRPAERDVSRKILAAASGLEAVVSDVLTFSREFRVRVRTTDAPELFDHALQECLHLETAAHSRRSTARLPALVIERPDHHTRPVPVLCDAALLNRALVNVIRNAIEAMTPDERDGDHWTPARRTLTLDARTERAAAPGGAEREMTVLAIADTGPGLRPDVLKRMFNPFFTTRAAGTGLGLAIVHRIIDAHGGMVRVRNRNEPHEHHAAGAAAGGTGGAIFEIFIPAHAAPQTAAPQPFVIQTTHTHSRIGNPFPAAQLAGALELAP